MNAAGSCESPEFDGAEVTAIDWADWLDSNPDFKIRRVLRDGSNFSRRVAVQSPATSSRLHVVMEPQVRTRRADVEYVSLTGSANRASASNATAT